MQSMISITPLVVLSLCAIARRRLQQRLSEVSQEGTNRSLADLEIASILNEELSCVSKIDDMTQLVLESEDCCVHLTQDDALLLFRESK